MQKDFTLLTEAVQSQVWDIMDESFPSCERRSRDQFFAGLQKGHCRLELLKPEADVLGLIVYWQLQDFVFVEHLAISSICRGTGLGKEFFSAFLLRQEKPMVLEVEPPRDTTSRRRIAFYERLGFCLNSQPYRQPAYQAGGQEVDLLLMTRPSPLSDSDFLSLRDELYRTVYGR